LSPFFIDIQNSGLAHIVGLSSQGSQLLRNLPESFSAEEIGKCLDEGLEPTYYFSIFSYSLTAAPIPLSNKQNKNLHTLPWFVVRIWLSQILESSYTSKSNQKYKL